MHLSLSIQCANGLRAGRLQFSVQSSCGDRTYGTNIMEEFYGVHTNDPDTNGKLVLDPFMGGGTTIVEALRSDESNRN